MRSTICQTFLEGIPLAQKKVLDRLTQNSITHFFPEPDLSPENEGMVENKMSQTKLAHENFLLDAPVRNL